MGCASSARTIKLNNIRHTPHEQNRVPQRRQTGLIIALLQAALIEPVNHGAQSQDRLLAKPTLYQSIIQIGSISRLKRQLKLISISFYFFQIGNHRCSAIAEHFISKFRSEIFVKSRYWLNRINDVLFGSRTLTIVGVT